jgi:hypothetical protein
MDHFDHGNQRENWVDEVAVENAAALMMIVAWC